MTDKVCPNCGWQMNKSVNECIDCGWAEFNWGDLTESAKKLIQVMTGANK